MKTGIIGAVFMDLRARPGVTVAATAAANPDMFAPIDGVSMETYATLTATVASGLDAAGWAALLAQHGIDQATWERANAGWTAKMGQDTTGTIAAAMAKAEQGQQQTAQNLGNLEASGRSIAIGNPSIVVGLLDQKLEARILGLGWARNGQK